MRLYNPLFHGELHYSCYHSNHSALESDNCEIRRSEQPMLTILLGISGLVLLLGALLRYIALRSRVERDPLVVRIDAILPQTQCRQCGYSGCKPYAVAIASGEADINQCPPGGDAGVRALANLLGRAYKPLNPEHGVHKPKSVAVIDESVCIGCTLCLQACPVDAILGGAKHMHTVIASECTGCELCVPPCPVDCISMEPVSVPSDNRKKRYPVFDISLGQYLRQARDETTKRDQGQVSANVARERHEFRLMRIEREKQERAQRHAQKSMGSGAVSNARDTAKKAAIAAAIERARMQKAAVVPANTDNLSQAVQSEIAEIEARRNDVMAAEKKALEKKVL